MYPGIVKEEHYTVCMEPGGRYLGHFNPQKASKEKPYAEVVAANLIEWLQEKGADKLYKLLEVILVM